MRLKKKDFKVLEEETVFEWPIFDIVKNKIRLANGKVVGWAHVDEKGKNVVLGILLTEDNEVILKREFRDAARDVVLEAPAGGTKTKTEKGRIKELLRECEEEVGFVGRRIEKLAVGYRSTRMTGRTHIYLLRDLEKRKPAEHEGELVEVIKLPFKKAWKIVLSGKESTTLETILGLALTKMKLGL